MDFINHVCFYMCATSVTLRNAIKSPVTFLNTRYYYVCTFRIRAVTTAVTKRFRPRGHPGGGQARVQDGVLTGGLEIWTNRSLLFTHAFRVCVASVSDRWRQRVRGSIASNTNVSFKQLCSRVVAITGPWNCVVYRDIRLLIRVE